MSDNVEQRRDILAGVDDLMQRYASEVTRPPKKTVPIPPPSWPGVRDRLSDDLRDRFDRQQRVNRGDGLPK